jgi:Uma2 family endonuclease
MSLTARFAFARGAGPRCSLASIRAALHNRAMSEAPAFSVPSRALAPWAEPVPGAGSMTVEQLGDLPDDGWCYELVEGVLVRRPPSSYGASAIAATLLVALGVYVRQRGLGRVTGEQGGYVLDPAAPRQTEVAPDVGYVRAERDIPLGAPAATRAFPAAPDLAVEVAAPRQSRPALARKTQRYVAAGTRLVWVVWPRRREVDVWHLHAGTPLTLRVGDTLDGEDVVPGFTLPVADLFV